jgi:hypothetical protein
MKTIQINNKHYQECDIIILESSNNQNTGLDLNVLGALSLESKAYTCYNAQHLYILSNDEIKEGVDYYHDSHNNLILKSSSNSDHKVYGYKKVIATTNSSLKVIDHNNTWDSSNDKHLPQISQQFIEHYITEYNKGNVVSKVLVEVELVKNDCDCGATTFEGCSQCLDYKIKLNQNNEISILINQQETIEEAAKNTTNKYINEREKQTAYLEFIEGAKWQAERSYSREEVISLLKEYRNCIITVRDKEIEHTNQWIKDNLK